jgi:hypothetical protein
MSALRHCTACHREMSEAEFYPQQHIRRCKGCHRERCREYYRSRSRHRECDSEVSSLYLAVNPKIPGEVKVGKSGDPESRLFALGKGQNFRLELVAVYPGQGDLETAVHELLAAKRVADGPSREWFACSLDFAMQAVQEAMRG